MKICIVITYFDRQFQLEKTLKSFAKTEHKDFEVIIVDDCSLVPPIMGVHDFPIEVYRTKDKKWLDGSPTYNLGILKAFQKNPDVIIIQNAETYHVGDVISYASTVTDKNYISFACYNLSKEDTFRIHYQNFALGNIFREIPNINDIINKNNNHAVNNDDNAWLNHKVIRPMGYHWCSAITANNMRKLNGFNENFSDGYCFEDDEFLARVRMLGLEVEITDSPFVVHQWHNRNYVPKNWNQLFQINKKLFEQVQRSNNPVAIHKFTKDFNV